MRHFTAPETDADLDPVAILQELLCVLDFGIKVVGVERRPFRDTNGNLEGRNKNEEKMLDLYRYSALLCLMHTYNKKTMTQARKEAEHFFQFPEWFKSMNGI